MFERRQTETKVERLAYGREGLVWTIGELKGRTLSARPGAPLWRRRGPFSYGKVTVTFFEPVPVRPLASVTVHEIVSETVIGGAPSVVQYRRV